MAFPHRPEFTEIVKVRRCLWDQSKQTWIKCLSDRHECKTPRIQKGTFQRVDPSKKQGGICQWSIEKTLISMWRVTTTATGMAVTRGIL